MKKNTVRVRFAPSPTGMMHLGGIRTALMNYLFARKYKGTYIVRIEDTDQKRDFDPGGKHIISDLLWLGLEHDEGPDKGGPHEPYLQSQRGHLYKEKLEYLIQNNFVYRCFCTIEQLEKKRKRQEALKLPPRYDRTCLALEPTEIQAQLNSKNPFVWRIKLDHEQTIKINDLAHKVIQFELKNFSDFPITRQDGTFTFMFANFVDDFMMNITHVFRGEDHLTNTAGQGALYQFFKKEPPIFWHMPIICNVDGKKLSKRDFGFSLRDLQNAGFLPEAINNYLAIIGSSVEQEIMSLDELAQSLNLEHPNPTGQIKYDIEKLKWVNHKWIARYSTAQLAQACRPYLQQAYQEAQNINDTLLASLLEPIQSDLITLTDVIPALKFYFNEPTISSADIEACISKENREFIGKVIEESLPILDNSASFVENIKKIAQEKKIPLKEFFWLLRLGLMGQTNGPAVHYLINMIGTQQARIRIQSALDLLRRVT
ncbi:MAG: glutamate--tRNA ligase [bacterium]|nr:glutamate--tRNA ligase [bacterium]